MRPQPAIWSLVEIPSPSLSSRWKADSVPTSYTMADNEKTQIYDDGPHHERAMSTPGGRRRSTVTSVNMNKNLDAKCVNACSFLENLS